MLILGRDTVVVRRYVKLFVKIEALRRSGWTEVRRNFADLSGKTSRAVLYCTRVYSRASREVDETTEKN